MRSIAACPGTTQLNSLRCAVTDAPEAGGFIFFRFVFSVSFFFFPLISEEINRRDNPLWLLGAG
jgi:hypothetical protein